MNEHQEARDPRIILASASPRRRELLRQVGVAFRVVVAAVDESPLPDELIHPLIDEAEFWARRVAAIQTGDLRLYRIAGVISSKVE